MSTIWPSTALRIDSIDAGVRRIVLDALGNPIEERDSKGALVLAGLRRAAPADPALGAGRDGRAAHAARAPGLRRRRGGRADPDAGARRRTCSASCISTTTKRGC